MSDRKRNSLPQLEEVQFLLGASVLTYEDGRVKIVSWADTAVSGVSGMTGLSVSVKRMSRRP